MAAAAGGGGGGGQDDARTLLRLLGGVPPRRAVVLEAGALRERADAPGTPPEVETMSAVCEVVRRMAGLPVYSRDSALLVQQCLDTNAHGAWQALYSDVKTGDVDWPRLHAQLLAGGGVRVCVGCLLAPRDATHLLHMAGCLVATMEAAEEPVRRDFSVALGRKLSDFVDVLTRHHSVMRRDVRDGVLTSLARMLAKADMPLADVAAALDRVLDRRHDDLVRLFTHLPVADCVALLPCLLPKLVARAGAAGTAAARYPLLAALARSVSRPSAEAAALATPALAAGIADLVSSTLEAQLASAGGLDARTALVCAMLVPAAGEASGRLAGVLARALERTATAALV